MKMQHKSSSKKYSKNKKFLIPFLFLTTIFFVILVFCYYYFSISSIEIVSDDKLSAIKGLENIKNNNIFLLTDAKIRATILTANPLIKNVEIEKVYPNRIKLTVETDKPLAAIKANQGFLFLDDKGKVIFKQKEIPKDLPLISYYQLLDYGSISSGDKIDLRDILTALHFLKKTSEIGINTISVDINGLDMIRLNLEDRSIIFTTEKDKNIQDYQLETIVRQFKVEGKNFETLDLRFDKPVIKLK